MAADLHTECITARRDATALELAQEMGQESVGTVVIVDDKDAPVGIVTDRDLLCRVIAKDRNENEVRAEEIMSAPLLLASPGTTTQDALALMTANHVRRLPVVDDDGKVIRVLSLDEVITGLSDELFSLGQAIRIELTQGVRSTRARLRREAREDALEGIRAEVGRVGSRARDFLREELQDVVDRLGRDRGA